MMHEFRSPIGLELVVTVAIKEAVGTRCTIADLAEAHSLNRSLVQRMVALLCNMGVLRTFSGRVGGVKLARRSDEIIVGELFRATIGNEHDAKTDGEAHEISNFEAYLAHLKSQARSAVCDSLGEETIADAVARLTIAATSPEAERRPLVRSRTTT